jgi:hypothetical protein
MHNRRFQKSFIILRYTLVICCLGAGLCCVRTSSLAEKPQAQLRLDGEWETIPKMILSFTTQNHIEGSGKGAGLLKLFLRRSDGRRPNLEVHWQGEAGWITDLVGRKLTLDGYDLLIEFADNGFAQHRDRTDEVSLSLERVGPNWASGRITGRVRRISADHRRIEPFELVDFQFLALIKGNQP